MVGSVELLNGDANGMIVKDVLVSGEDRQAEPLPAEFDPTDVVGASDLPVDLGFPNGNATVGAESGNGKKREIVLGRNVHTMCLAVTEPEADEDVTGEREAQMAGVLARYRMSLIERTKHHLESSST